MRELEYISLDLHDKLISRFDTINLGDEKAEDTTDPKKARFFNFDYISKDGKNFGNITISLVDGENLEIIFGSNLINSLSDEEYAEWRGFLKNLRFFAKRNELMFTPRHINKSSLDRRDLEKKIVTNAPIDTDDLSIAESKLYGLGNNKRVSFGDVGTHKIIIKHRDQIDPERHGSRSRQIEHVFIETPLGERFLLDHTNLHGARAIANYMREGGSYGDEGCQLINEMVREMASMRHFVRNVKTRTFEDTETTGMVEAAIYRYNEVKNNLKKLQGRNGKDMLESMLGEASIQDDELDIDALRERFVKKIYDDRFNDALPYVYKAYQKQKELETSESKEFMTWANDVVETTWDTDSDDTDEDSLIQIMQNPLLAGIDGIDAKAIVDKIQFLHSDELNADIENLARTQGPDSDVRLVIANWLKANGEQSLANQILTILQQENTNTEPMPQQQPVPPQRTGQTTMDEPVVNEEISILKWLSGLGKK